MKRKILVGLGLALLMLMLVMGLGAAQGTGDPSSQVMSPRGSTEALAVSERVTSTFSYQGRLREHGEPVTGAREMVFRLYADETCLERVGAPITQTVTINQGLFNVDLRVDQRDFNGQALWLETEVGGIAVGCRPIQAAPYALGLRPGAIISGSLPNDANVTAVNTSTSGSALLGLAGSGSREDLHPGGLYYSAGGEFAGPNGVIGATSNEYVDGYGVVGLAHGSAGRGVYGYASREEGLTYGVYGQSESYAGYGVYGHTTAVTGTTYGVRGTSYSEEGYGVYGYASAITGTTNGVYGIARSPYGAGGYFANTSGEVDLIVGRGGGNDDGIIASEPDDAGSDLFLSSNDEVWVRLDRNDDEDGNFEIQNGTGDTVFRVDEAGDVAQPRTGNGLVKAAATVYCSNSSPFVSRSFNNFNGMEISVSPGTNPGECSIDFNFEINDRFWSATAVHNGARFVTCNYGADNDTLDCYRFNGDGSGVTGAIMVVIY